MVLKMHKKDLKIRLLNHQWLRVCSFYLTTCEVFPATYQPVRILSDLTGIKDLKLHTCEVGKHAHYLRLCSEDLTGIKGTGFSYILSGTLMPSNPIPFFITSAVNSEICKRSNFFSSVSALPIECSV